jgi:hypothetical protein
MARTRVQAGPPPGLAAIFRRDDGNRAMRMLGDLGTDRSHQQPGEPTRPARTHHDHVRAPGRADEFFRRGAADRLNGHGLRPRFFAEVAQHLVHFDVRGLTDVLSHSVIFGVSNSAAPVAPANFMGGDHRQRRATGLLPSSPIPERALSDRSRLFLLQFSAFYSPSLSPFIADIKRAGSRTIGPSGPIVRPNVRDFRHPGEGSYVVRYRRRPVAVVPDQSNGT